MPLKKITLDRNFWLPKSLMRGKSPFWIKTDSEFYGEFIKWTVYPVLIDRRQMIATTNGHQKGLLFRKDVWPSHVLAQQTRKSCWRYIVLQSIQNVEVLLGAGRGACTSLVCFQNLSFCMLTRKLCLLCCHSFTSLCHLLPFCCLTSMFLGHVTCQKFTWQAIDSCLNQEPI